ncbi:MAG TPA: DUF4169 family protein [Polyangiaceae bacterium]|nr:DUF4169 family protein [Polyangiaceae bacterium]
MSNVVNLNKFRKQKAKAEREKRAETNRRLHGRTKLERARDEQQKQQLQAKLAGKLLQTQPADGEGDPQK